MAARIASAALAASGLATAFAELADANPDTLFALGALAFGLTFAIHALAPEDDQ